MNKLRFTLVALFFMVSCSKTELSGEAEKEKINQEKKKYTIQELVLQKYSAKVADWQEYIDYQDFLNKNFTVSNTDLALQNSEELSKLSKSLRDSILPNYINKTSLQARLNVLYSESFRLYDMSLISAIQDTEVSHQLQKICDAFSSVNAKINTILEQQELEKLYGDNSFFMIRDSVTLKNTSKKKIPKTVKPNKVEKPIPRYIKQKNSKKKKFFVNPNIKKQKKDE